MKTTKIIFILIAIVVTGILHAQDYTADLKKSELKWTGKKVGGEHFGFISLKEGNLKLENNAIVSGSFTIDMNSITCIDLENEAFNTKLVNHLKSDDFFGVETFPTASLVITEGGAFTEGKTDVKGNLSIKGITHPISFTVKKVDNDFVSAIAVDRSKFDVRYGSKTFFEDIGDKAIDDIFTVVVKLIVE